MDLRPAHSTRAAKAHSVRASAKSQRKPPRKSLPRVESPPDEKLVRELVSLALRLRVIYGTALSVELALRKQNAEQDVDLAACLRHGVCVSTADLCARAEAIVKRLGGTLPEPLP